MDQTVPTAAAKATFNLRSLLTDGVAIALATAFAYFATFVYEVAYCSNFAIPISLITPNTSTILVAAAAIGTIFVSSIQLLALTTPLFRKSKKKNASSLWAVLGAIIVGLIVISKIYELNAKQLGYIVLGLIVLFLSPIIPLTAMGIWHLIKSKIFRRPARKVSTTVATTTASAEPKEELWLTADEFLENWIPQKIVRQILFFGGIILIAYIVGDGNASTQKRFLVFKDHPDVAVLRIYGDLMISAKFNRETKEVSSELSLLWLSEKKQITFANEEIGPLKLAKPKKMSN